MKKPIKIYLKQSLGIITIFAPIWASCYLSIEVLPDGWAESPFTHWWTFPTVISLLASVFSLGIFGAKLVFDDWINGR